MIDVVSRKEASILILRNALNFLGKAYNYEGFDSIVGHEGGIDFYLQNITSAI